MQVEAPVAAAGGLSLRRWLGALQVLLEPLAPERLVLLQGLMLPTRLQWVDRLPEDLSTVDPDDDERELQHRSGWLLPIEPRGPQPVLLFVVTDHTEPPSDTLMHLASTLCRCAWRIRNGDGDDEARALGEAVHGLRNGLNSVLMSAAVITTCADLLPERLQPIAREIESAAHRSVDRLHKLTALIEPGR